VSKKVFETKGGPVLKALLDVNVLIALHDREHVHHNHVVQWLHGNQDAGWASCPLTQNGCLRIMSQPGYSNPQPMAALVRMLRQSTRASAHTWLPDDISLLDERHLNGQLIHNPAQLTDLYLLALAVKHSAKLVTLDRRIPINAVVHATPAHLIVL
jgi:uncharacterized protein